MGYLTAFLNSNIFRFSFKDFFPELLGDTRELSKVFFETVTVKEVDDETNNYFESLVEKIYINKLNGVDSSLLEIEIENQLIEIYDLTDYEQFLIKDSEGKTFSINSFSDSVNS